MAAAEKKRSVRPSAERPSITRIDVCGFKSLKEKQSVDIAPLTVLAGANSSGKSSVMQPLLLLKQTLEASYDPGALLLNGPNVAFTSGEQLLSRGNGRSGCSTFDVGVTAGDVTVTPHFEHDRKRGFSLHRMSVVMAGKAAEMVENADAAQVIRLLFGEGGPPFRMPADWRWVAVRRRCFLTVGLESKPGKVMLPVGFEPAAPAFRAERLIRSIIHVPGLRGNPARNYPLTPPTDTYPGTFEKYVAGVISHWQQQKDEANLRGLTDDLRALNLTSRVRARTIDETQVEIQVDRLTVRRGRTDYVSIADVGFGVSQVLPVLVAIRAASRGQMVYLEQPEIHLHPRAQLGLAKVLAGAAKQGVRLVVETHSSLLLLGIQTLVAKGELAPDDVKLHWFQRGKDGVTKVSPGGPDKTGAFGNWPQDFGDVLLDAQSQYLDAADKAQAEERR